MNLKHALRVHPGESIALVGSGGKTTALFALARQLDNPVLATTTTHFSQDQLFHADNLIHISKVSKFQEIAGSIKPGISLLVGEPVADERVSGVPEKLLAEINQYSKTHGFNFLIEADGSRGRPLKAPAAHEPVIPHFVDQVIVTIGLSGMGKPLNSDNVHRPEIYSTISGVEEGREINSAAISKVLNSDQGGLKGIPQNARRVCLVNQADDEGLQAQGKRLASSLLPIYDSVIVASLLRESSDISPELKSQGPPESVEVSAVFEPVVAIILAAGGSQRLGRPKQLLNWEGISLVRHAALTAITSDLEHVIVVIGSSSEKVEAEVADLPVEVVLNLEWKSGQSSSTRAGLSAIPDNTGAVIFMLADQPRVSRRLIRTLVERHASTMAPIIAPMVDGRRGNPVLFDRSTFKDFNSISGDAGGRALFSKYQIDWIDWHDPSILLDIDTDDDYRLLISNST